MECYSFTYFQTDLRRTSTIKYAECACTGTLWIPGCFAEFRVHRLSGADAKENLLHAQCQRGPHQKRQCWCDLTVFDAGHVSAMRPDL